MHRLLIGTAIAASLIVAGCDQKPDKDKSAIMANRPARRQGHDPDRQGRAKFEMATNGESLKAELPSFVPLYPERKVQTSMAGPIGGGHGGGIVFTTSAAPERHRLLSARAKAAGMKKR